MVQGTGHEPSCGDKLMIRKKWLSGGCCKNKIKQKQSWTLQTEFSIPSPVPFHMAYGSTPYDIWLKLGNKLLSQHLAGPLFQLEMPGFM